MPPNRYRCLHRSTSKVVLTEPSNWSCLQADGFWPSKVPGRGKNESLCLQHPPENSKRVFLWMYDGFNNVQLTDKEYIMFGSSFCVSSRALKNRRFKGMRALRTIEIGSLILCAKRTQVTTWGVLKNSNTMLITALSSVVCTK